jgi:S1/P1 Nuclease
MRIFMLAAALLAFLAAPVRARNDKGHMVVAELAYLRLTPEQRQAVTAILKQHPHWDEFLIAQRPDNVPEDQWAFWRAATWPDWVKHAHQQFNKPKVAQRRLSVCPAWLGRARD